MALKDCKFKSFFELELNRRDLKNEEPPTVCTFDDLKKILTNDRQHFKYAYG